MLTADGPSVITALGIRCERVLRDTPVQSYVGRLGQFRLRVSLGASVELQLSATSERDFPAVIGFGDTLDEAEQYIERVMRSRASRLQQALELRPRAEHLAELARMYGDDLSDDELLAVEERERDAWVRGHQECA